MDPITAAIIAALTAGAVSGATKVAEQAVSDAYSKLKQLLGKKFGTESQVVKAVTDLEASPKSDGQKKILEGAVLVAKADQDPELKKAAQALLKSIKALPGGTQIVQTAIGNENIQIAGDSNTVKVGETRNKK